MDTSATRATSATRDTSATKYTQLLTRDTPATRDTSAIRNATGTRVTSATPDLLFIYIYYVNVMTSSLMKCKLWLIQEPIPFLDIFIF